MAIIARYTNPDGREITARLEIIRKYKKGWYLTDIALGKSKKSLQYYKNLQRDYPTPLVGWVFVGETTGYSDSGEYREDGSIVYTKENYAYRRLYEMTIATDKEEMCAMLSDKVVVFPSYNNKDNLVKVFDYGYAIEDSKLIDPISGTSSSIVALMHTHPNGSGPSTVGGDGDFAAMYIPYKPSYVMLVKQDNLSNSYMAFIAGSDRPFNARTNGFTGGCELYLSTELTVDNIINGKFKLIQYSINNKSKIKQLIKDGLY